MPSSSVRSASASVPALPLGLKPYHVVFVLHFTVIVLLGTFYSLLTGSHHANLHNTLARATESAFPLEGSTISSDSASQLPPLPPTLVPPTHPLTYWANRKNLVNQLFVKRAWLWTTLAWAFQLFALRSSRGARIVKESVAAELDPARTDRPSPSQNGKADRDVAPPATIASPVAKSTLRWMIATSCWRDLFTSWFFGPPLAERILTATGGTCIPSAGLNSPIDASFCRTRSPLTASTHPDLFTKLHLATSSSRPAQALRPLWRGGHDISGHTFLMVLSALYLLEEIAPFLPHLLPSSLAARLFPREGWAVANPFFTRIGPAGGRKERAESRNRVDRAAVAAVAFVLAIVALWSWMLLMTAVYFHTPLEKVSGLVVALGCWALLPKGG